MNNILEVARQKHEEIERLEQSAVHQLLQHPKTHKDHVIIEQRVAKFISLISTLSKELIKLYTDDDDLFAQEQCNATTADLTTYYDSLKSIKAFYKQLPNETARPFYPTQFLKDPEIEIGELEGHFSGEEGYARHLDLHSNFLEYLNIKGLDQINYLTYLDRFERFKDIPLRVKRGERYAKYILNIFGYLSTWIRRCQPLFNIEKLETDAAQEFEALWAIDKVPFWEMDKYTDNLQCDLFCLLCDKVFAKQSVFEAHKGGKRHLRGLEKAVDPSIQNVGTQNVDIKKAMLASQVQEYQLMKPIAKIEFQIRKYVAYLAVIREDTKSHIERKQALTDKERSEDIDEAPVDLQIEEESDTETKLYNPLKLPIGWDGKPIPFWLYKMHGLGVEYPCEICGGFIYMGRKAFDRHFQEFRHAHGMRCLGIPNGKYFQDITKIDDAYSLAEKLKRIAKDENVQDDLVEELEDEDGNVYNKRTYEDLKRQGII